MVVSYVFSDIVAVLLLSWLLLELSPSLVWLFCSMIRVTVLNWCFLLSLRSIYPTLNKCSKQFENSLSSTSGTSVSSGLDNSFPSAYHQCDMTAMEIGTEDKGSSSPAISLSSILVP